MSWQKFDCQGFQEGLFWLVAAWGRIPSLPTMPN